MLILRLLTAVLVWLSSAHCLAAEATPPVVLFINSYHRGYAWSDGIEEGLRQRFRESGKKIELSIEYLDSRRFVYGAQLPSIAKSMEVKYANYRPKIVVVSDNAAFDFAVTHREKLFPGVPIVFCGYNNLRPETLQGMVNITGVNEAIDFAKTVEMALTVHPGTKTLAFVLSTAEASNQNNARVVEQTVLPKFQGRYNVVVLKDASLDEVRKTLEQLPRESLLFLSGQIRDQSAGRTLTPEENGRLITGISPIPAYSFWDFHIGTGVVGGRILYGVDQGTSAADMALRLLDGEPIENIPPLMTTPAREVFDYPAMNKFGIKTTDLPPNARVVNQPTGVWDRYFWQIIGTLVFLLFQTTLLLFLARNMRLLRKTTAQMRKLAQVVEQTPDSVIITNTQAEIEYVNQAFIDKSGYLRDEVTGKNPRLLQSGKTPPELFKALWARISKGENWAGELCNKRKDGSEVIERVVITAITQKDGKITHYAAIQTDITDKKVAEEQIRTLAFFDSLTSLPNRRLLMDRLHQAVVSSTRSQSGGALLFVDLDNFKSLNDTRGHDVGDQLLIQVAQRLSASVREGDSVARLGGDEFVVLLEGLSSEASIATAEARLVGEKILAALDVPYQLDKCTHLSTSSIGITLFADGPKTIDDILKRADLAMYQAKAGGRNTLSFFQPAPGAQAATGGSEVRAFPVAADAPGSR